MGQQMQMRAGQGLPGLLKDGYKHMSGLEEAIGKNIEACQQLSTITSTSLGPNGMNKLVINHLEKIFVTSDTGTIVKELEVVHPAAKMVVMAATMQESEFGDATNLVVSLAGELLKQAEELLRKGLHASEIVSGYERAVEKTFEVLKTLVCRELDQADLKERYAMALRPVLMAKQYGYHDVLTDKVSSAAAMVTEIDANGRASINVDGVRVSKIVGGSVLDSTVIRGMVVQRPAAGFVHRVEKAKVAVFGCGLEASATEAKSTVVIRSAEELMSYNKGEERMMEEAIRGIADSGAKVVVAGGSISEMALHFVDKYNLMVVKVTSKWELRRLCRAVGATTAVRLGPLTPEEMGYVDLAETTEIGGRRVTIFRHDGEDGIVATVALRGSTMNLLEDVERAVDDAVNTAKAACRDPRLLPGAGATEIELARQLQQYGDSLPGLEQYAVKNFAAAFEVVPRTLAENSGQGGDEAISSLYAAHTNGKTSVGIDVENASTMDAAEKEVFDLYATKANAIKLATDAAITVLRVDQIIMAKAAGGPKPPKPGAPDA